jgi:hypothetical protein
MTRPDDRSMRGSAPLKRRWLSLLLVAALAGCSADDRGTAADAASSPDATSPPDGAEAPDGMADAAACATDMCGTCDGDPSNDCAQDCAGTWGGTATFDACGRCLADRAGAPVCATMTLRAVADATVHAIRPDAPDGDSHVLQVGAPTAGVRETLLRFDLGALPPGALVASATLGMTGFTGTVWGSDTSVATSFVADDTWREDVVVWNTRPAAGPLLGSWALAYDDGQVEPRNVSTRLSGLAAVVRAEAEGDRLLSLVLGAPEADTRYFSREHVVPSEGPRLAIAYLEPLTLTVDAVADATVVADQPTTNFGAAELTVDRDRAEVYMRFDLSALPAAVDIRDVDLQATAFHGFAYGGDGNVYTGLVRDDGWDEAAITWQNRPAVSAGDLGSWWLWYDGEPRDQVGTNASPALRDAVIAEAAGDRRVSLRLHSPGYLTHYYPRDHGDVARRPRLTIRYVPLMETVIEPTADAWISTRRPDENHGVDPALWVDPDGSATYLRFDLRSMPRGVVVATAALQATAFNGFAYGGDGNVYTRLAVHDIWDEATITANDRPHARNDDLGHWWLWYDGTPQNQVGVNASPALLDVVLAEAAGDGAATFVLVSPGYSTVYRSREWGIPGERPRLTIQYVSP